MTSEAAPEYQHDESDVTTMPRHFLDPDPDDSASCLVCGDRDGYGVLHL